MNFNIEKFTGFICAEIPPKDMFQLLILVKWASVWLAVAIIDVYGGHVWDAYQALDRLSTRKGKFWALDSRMNQVPGLERRTRWRPRQDA